MKQNLPIIAIILLIIGCAPPKKVNDYHSNKSNTSSKTKNVVHQQFAPGTCSLSIKESSVKKIDGAYWLKGTVASIKGYGAGFHYEISKDSKIKVLLK
jgi:hypothetical protein